MLEICETVLFEVQQSGLMDISGILSGLELLDVAGYRVIEVMPPVAETNDWGTIRKFKQIAKATPLLVSVSLDVISEETLERFIESGAANGVEVFRIQDQKGNTAGLERAIGLITKAKKRVEYNIVYNKAVKNDSLIKSCMNFRSKGCTSVCVSDPLGELGPQDTIELVSLLKKETEMSVALRFSKSPELASIAYYAAAGAGADSLYCVLIPGHGRQRLPETREVASALTGFHWNVALDSEALDKAYHHFQKIGARGPRAYDVDILDKRYHVIVSSSVIEPEAEKRPMIVRDASSFRSSSAWPKPTPKLTHQRGKDKTEAASRTKAVAGDGRRNIQSTMEGTILKILVKEGDRVKRKERILILEAMKMQNDVLSPVDGVVTKILISEGEAVKDGQDLVTIQVSK